MSKNQLEIDKTCYEQNYLQVRELIQIMWRAPVVTITLTGGAWFGVYSLDDLGVYEKFFILILCALGNGAMIFAILRVRHSMQMHLDKIKKFSPENYAYKKNQGFLGNRTTSTTFSLMLGGTAVLNLVAALRIVCG